MPDHLLALLAIGLSAGLLGSCFGVGGGVIMVPALTYLAFPQKEAQALSLAAMVPMAIVGAARYRMTGQAKVDLPVAAAIGLAAVVGAIAGSHFVGQVSNELLRRAFAIFVLLTGLKMLLTR